MNKIFFKLIKVLVNLFKKLNLDKFILDKLIFNIGLNQVLENKKIYNEVKNIQEIELKIFSQNGEDGIIDYLLNKINLIPKSSNFVEIGVGDYRESNTRFIYNHWPNTNHFRSIDCKFSWKIKLTYLISLGIL